MLITDILEKGSAEPINETTPDIFIESSEIYPISGSLKKILVRYSIEAGFDSITEKSKWLENKFALENLYINISCNSSSSIESLNSFKSRNIIKNDKIESYKEFYTEDQTITVETFCGVYRDNNLLYKGNSIKETILQNNVVTTSSLGDINLYFINKTKDLRLLNVDDVKLQNYSTIDSSISSSEEIFIYKNLETSQKNNLYISYATNKEANVAYIFDLEKFLVKNSHTYRVLSGHPAFREFILSGSHILNKYTFFSKKSLASSNSQFNQFNDSIKILKLSDKAYDSRYILTATDFSSLFDRAKYSIKLNAVVYDFSYKFYEDFLLNPLKIIKKFIVSYKEKFEFFSKNNLIDNVNTHIFETYYLNKEKTENGRTVMQNIKIYIDQLSNMYNFFTKANISSLNVLFSTIFHPLYTNISLLSYLIESLSKLEKILDKFTENLISINENNAKSHRFGYFEFIKEFDFRDKSGEYNDNIIDYDYDLNYGYEVISNDNFDNRNFEAYNGLKTITQEEKNLRFMYEADKFFGSSSPEIVSTIKDLSISSIDLGSTKNYYIVGSFDNTNTSLFNEILVEINNYNKNKKAMHPAQAYFFDLADRGIFIKSIASRGNISKNNLHKSTIYDQNKDSYQDSISAIASTGINSLYFLIDDNKYLEIPSTITQYSASVGGASGSMFALTPEINSNYEAKPKKIIYYNNFFKDVLLESGENYELYELQESLVNDIFTKKLKFFNKYYILEKNKNNVIQPEIKIMDEAYINEAAINILPQYLSRNVLTGSALISTSDLL